MASAANAGVTSTFGNWGKNRLNHFSAEQKSELDKAIASQDYAAWKKIIGENARILEKINANNFSKYVEMQNSMKKASDIRQELGLNDARGLGMGGRPGGQHPRR